MAGNKVERSSRRGQQDKEVAEQEMGVQGKQAIQEHERENGPAAVLETENDGEEAKFGQQFFRVFFPNLYGEILRIPASFHQYLQNEPTGVISLKAQSGNTWLAELSKDAQGLFIGNGWKEFVADHSLEIGDFLTFRYDKRSKFSVVLFDGTCIEKPSAFHSKPHKHVIKLENDDGDMDMNASDPPEIPSTLLEESNEPTRKRIRETDLNDTISRKCSNVLEKGKKKKHGASVGSVNAASTSLNIDTNAIGQSEVPLEKINVNRTKKVRASTGLNNTKGRVHEESIPCNKSAKSTPLLLRMNKDVHKYGINIMTSQRQPTVISHRLPVTEEQNNCTLQRAKRFKSKNPFVHLIMKDTNVYVGFFMKLPCKFVKCLPQTDTKMKLWDPQGKSWEVNYIYHRELSSGAFSSGWSSFSLSNNLEKFDVCVFELLSKDNIKVHIYRVAPDVTPLLPDPNRKQ